MAAKTPAGIADELSAAQSRALIHMGSSALPLNRKGGLNLAGRYGWVTHHRNTLDALVARKLAHRISPALIVRTRLGAEVAEVFARREADLRAARRDNLAMEGRP